ncbi:Cytochrome c oxidase subunit 6b-2 [Orobanche minor]
MGHMEVEHPRSDPQTYAQLFVLAKLFSFFHRVVSSILSPMAEIEIKTAPADFRFPTTNQTRHCFTRYIEFHRCVAAKGEESNDCGKFAKYYRSLCPGEWIDKWNEQRENGTFPGPL